MKKFVEYLRYVISGMVFGIANIIPGVSGGTMLVVFGVYDRLTESISGIKAIKKNIIFLLFFGIGAGAGLLGFAYVIKEILLKHFVIQTNMYFIGLILGSIPLIYKLGTSEKKPKPLCIVPFVLAMALVISLAALENVRNAETADTGSGTHLEMVDDYYVEGDEEAAASTAADTPAETSQGFDLGLSVKLFFSAILASITMIIPGVSGSFVMLLLGVYDTIVGAISFKSLNFFIIIPFAIGVVIGIVGGAKLISMLIKKYKLMVYSAIMGLVIGSVYAILPEGFGFNLQTGYGFVCLLFGILTSVLVEKLGRGESAN